MFLSEAELRPCPERAIAVLLVIGEWSTGRTAGAVSCLSRGHVWRDCTDAGSFPKRRRVGFRQNCRPIEGSCHGSGLSRGRRFQNAVHDLQHVQTEAPAGAMGGAGQNRVGELGKA